MLKKFVYNEQVNRIDIFDERHYEIVIDEVAHYFPSVTTYLEAFPCGYGYKLWLQNTKDPDKVLTEAGQLGTSVHNIIERTLLGETITYNPTIDIEVWERYLSWCIFWREFNKTHKVEYDEAYMETIIWNLKYRVAGTYDLMPSVDGMYEIWDWKSGKSIYETSKIQICTYGVLCMLKYGIKIDTCRLIHLHPSLNRKGYQVTEINGIEEIKNNFRDFLHTQKVWLRANGGIKPKFVSYPTEINLDFIKNHEIIEIRPEPKVKKKPARVTKKEDK